MKDYLNYRGDFRNLSKKDLETLFIRLKDYHLKYRDHLGIDSKISFVVELEFQDVLLYYVKKELSKDLRVGVFTKIKVVLIKLMILQLVVRFLLLFYMI